MQKLQLKLDRARWFILQNSPFYGSLAMSLTDKLGNPHGKTACVDGKRIFWDESFLEKLTDEETRYVLLHETLHCAHGHLWRFPAGTGDHKTANCACDHAINLTLNGAQLDISMPKGGLADSQFAGMAEEEIYSALAQKQSQNGKPDNQPGGADGGQDGQSGQDGEQSGQDGQSSADGDACGDYCAPADESGQDGQSKEQSLRESWQQKVIQAAMQAKASAGNLPGDLQRQLEKITTTQIDWRAETAQFLKNSISSRNDWTRSPRRHAWQNVVYPSRKANEVGWILGVRDTSGSISDTLAAEFSSILANACAELNCGLILLDCDTDIAAEYRIEPGGDVPLTAAGGGGTSFDKPFARAAELIESGEKIAGLVYLTDLCGDGWPADETIPTLCLCTENSIAPSGRTVQIMN